MRSYGVVILAAGSSSRLGRPKQLLIYHGLSLIENSISVASALNTGPVLTVLGANAESIYPVIQQLSTGIIVNELWKEGMGSSVQCGVRSLMDAYADLQGIMLMVSDQPFVTTALLQQIVTKHEQTGKKLVAAFYKDAPGVPAFFHRDFFPLLTDLQGQQGAKKILSSHPADLAVVPFEKGAVDIDTEEDWRKFGDE